MLIITIHNDSSGDIKTGNYNYKVFINKELLEEGRIEKHNRSLGYQELISRVAKETKKKQKEVLRELLENNILNCFPQTILNGEIKKLIEIVEERWPKNTPSTKR